MSSFIFNSKGKFTVATLVFASLFFMLSILFDHILSESLKSADENTHIVMSQIMAETVEADVAVIGSSRALVHYDCDLIEQNSVYKSCINLGVNATGHLGQEPILKFYYSRSPDPDVLIINFDADSFSPTVSEPKFFQPFSYAPYITEGQNLYEDMLRLEPELWKYKYIPMYEYVAHEDPLYQSVKTLVGSEPDWERGRNRKGYWPNERGWDGKFDKFVNENPNGISFPINDDSVNVVKNMIELGLSKNSKVYLVFAPQYEPFTQMLHNYEDIVNQIQSLADQYQLVFVDYSSDPDIVSDKSKFYNSQHLNSFAAEEFTLKVVEDILRAED